jgi:hypothetical protein
MNKRQKRGNEMIIEGGERGDLLNKRVYTHVIKYKR